jgi:hypothetical protein
MAFDAHQNFAYTTVANNPGTSGTTITVQTGTGPRFPMITGSGGYSVVICPFGQLPTPANAEIVTITGTTNNGSQVTGDSFTVTRAAEGTSAKTIAAGYQFFLGVTKKTITDIETAVTALQSGSSFPTSTSAGQTVASKSDHSWDLSDTVFSSQSGTSALNEAFKIKYHLNSGTYWPAETGHYYATITDESNVPVLRFTNCGDVSVQGNTNQVGEIAFYGRNTGTGWNAGGYNFPHIGYIFGRLSFFDRTDNHRTGQIVNLWDSQNGETFVISPSQQDFTTSGHPVPFMVAALGGERGMVGINIPVDDIADGERNILPLSNALSVTSLSASGFGPIGAIMVGIDYVTANYQAPVDGILSQGAICIGNGGNRTDPASLFEIASWFIGYSDGLVIDDPSGDISQGYLKFASTGLAGPIMTLKADSLGGLTFTTQGVSNTTNISKGVVTTYKAQNTLEAHTIQTASTTTAVTNAVVVATTASITLTLPDATTSTWTGVEVLIKNASGGSITVAMTGGQTVDGSGTSITLTNNQYLRLLSRGTTNWLKIST